MPHNAIEFNGYFIFVMGTVLVFHLLECLATWSNVRALAETLPEEFCDVYDPQKYLLSQRYSRESARLDLIESNVQLVIFLLFWLCGGYRWLDQWVRGYDSAEWLRGLVFVTVLYLGMRLAQLPASLYSTFGLEAHYGFNRTTWQTYVLDQIKGLCVAGALGLPLFAGVQLLLEHWGGNAWWVVWLVVAGFSVLLTWLAPRWILPLFYQFKPLANGELKQAIHELAQKCEFPMTEVLEIDGSRRSSRANAFFTGFGKNKKIALYDTLVAKHPVEELVAVLAHEIGHFKLKHVTQGLVLAIGQMGLMFGLLGFFLNRAGLFRAFGVQEVSVYGSLVFFSMLFTPLSRLLGLAMLAVSRRNEFAADAYAAGVTGNPAAMISGLKRLASDNLANLTPHPLYVFLNYSHPPMLERVAALRGKYDKSTLAHSVRH